MVSVHISLCKQRRKKGLLFLGLDTWEAFLFYFLFSNFSFYSSEACHNPR